MSQLKVESFFEQKTSTWTHIVVDQATRLAAIIDSVLDYDPDSGKVSTTFADQLIEYIQKEQLTVQWILETHIHADHLTAAHYLQKKLGGKIAVGSHIVDVLKFWVPFFELEGQVPLDGSQFDDLLHDQTTYFLGESSFLVMHTPGHTPACASYLFNQEYLFAGDTIFMPDVGTSRTDFPGGSAQLLYQSIQKLLALPLSTKIFMCHDYPPNDRPLSSWTTVENERLHNVLVHDRISEQEFVEIRTRRDHHKPVPRLLLPSLQINIRAGALPEPGSHGVSYLKIPLNQLS